MRKAKVAILGHGIAGAAIARALSKRAQFDVFVIPGTVRGSTHHNQKWKHSGLLYSSAEFARRMWTAHQAMHPRHEAPFVLRAKARYLALEESTLTELSSRWARWNTGEWGLAVRELDRAEYGHAGELGETNAVGGFETPDCIIDYPAIVESLRDAAASRGVVFLDGSAVDGLDLRRGKALRVRLRTGEFMAFDACVVAMGAWSVPLLRSAGLSAPVVVRRCLVLRFAGELVPCLTVCMDARGDGRHSRDASLAPFRGETVAAEADGDEVDEPVDASFPAGRVDRLIRDYAACFPGIRTAPLVASEACFKLEERGALEPQLDFRIYDRSSLSGWDDRVTLAVPGKASLAFELANRVADRFAIPS